MGFAERALIGALVLSTGCLSEVFLPLPDRSNYETMLVSLETEDGPQITAHLASDGVLPRVIDIDRHPMTILLYPETPETLELPLGPVPLVTENSRPLPNTGAIFALRFEDGDFKEWELLEALPKKLADFRIARPQPPCERLRAGDDIELDGISSTDEIMGFERIAGDQILAITRECSFYRITPSSSQRAGGLRECDPVIASSFLAAPDAKTLWLGMQRGEVWQVDMDKEWAVVDKYRTSTTTTSTAAITALAASGPGENFELYAVDSDGRFFRYEGTSLLMMRRDRNTKPALDDPAPDPTMRPRFDMLRLGANEVIAAGNGLLMRYVNGEVIDEDTPDYAVIEALAMMPDGGVFGSGFRLLMTGVRGQLLQRLSGGWDGSADFYPESGDPQFMRALVDWRRYVMVAGSDGTIGFYVTDEEVYATGEIENVANPAGWSFARRINDSVALSVPTHNDRLTHVVWLSLTQ